MSSGKKKIRLHWKEIAHDRVLCAAVHFTAAEPPGLKSFGAVGGLAVAATLGRYDFRPRPALIPVARPGAQDISQLIWERLTKINIDVDVEPTFTLEVIVNGLQEKGQGPTFAPAGNMLNQHERKEYSGSFYRKGKEIPSGARDPDKTVFWWGKRAPEAGREEVKIDMHKGTKMRRYLPSNADPFKPTTLYTVHLRPKTPIGNVRVFQPPLLFLSKLFTDRQVGGDAKVYQDFLDVERLLSAQGLGPHLDLSAKTMGGWLDNMPRETFLGLQRKVTGWCEKNSRARWMNDWEFKQLEFADGVTAKEREKIKAGNLNHWINIMTSIQTMLHESAHSTVHSLAKAPFHVRSRLEQAERLAALADLDASVPTLRRSKRVKVFNSSV